MTDNQYIKDYIIAHPQFLHGGYSELAKKFDSNYEQVRAIARRLRNKLENKEIAQPVETPLGYKGELKSGKKWQLPNGEWRESLQFDVDRNSELLKFKEDFINDLKELAPRVFTSKPVEKGDCLFEISLPDLHFGKGDVEKLKQRFFDSVMDLLDKAKGIKIDRILLPIGNDGLNSEGKRRSTTSGTPQFDSLDWRESFRIYWVALVEMIDILSQHYPVDVVVVLGNHDFERMFYVGDVIGAYFAKYNNVTVNNSYDIRKYVEYGTNMILYTHGDKEKYSDLPLIMATEQPEMFARTKCREAHCGHFHKEMMNEFRGVKVRFLPSICGTDEWHKMMGYDHFKAAQGYIWNKKTGLEGYLQVNHYNE